LCGIAETQSQLPLPTKGKQCSRFCYTHMLKYYVAPKNNHYEDCVTKIKKMPLEHIEREKQNAKFQPHCDHSFVQSLGVYGAQNEREQIQSVANMH
jgi:hypothetical protein